MDPSLSSFNKTPTAELPLFSPFYVCGETLNCRGLDARRQDQQPYLVGSLEPLSRSGYNRSSGRLRQRIGSIPAEKS
jgi:hypothetical protein